MLFPPSIFLSLILKENQLRYIKINVTTSNFIYILIIELTKIACRRKCCIFPYFCFPWQANGQVQPDGLLDFKSMCQEEAPPSTAVNRPGSTSIFLLLLLYPRTPLLTNSYRKLWEVRARASNCCRSSDIKKSRLWSLERMILMKIRDNRSLRT